ncbi:Os10g0470066, partial [Oryza sativa Japonica Group]
GRKLQLSLSTSLSSPAAKKRDIANRRRALFISNSYSFHSHLTMTNNFGFDPIPFHLLQQRERRHVMVALERALCTAAVTSSPFPLIWTKPGQAVAPASSPQPPLHFPSRISKDGATSVEIVHRLLHLRSPSPLPNPPPPVSTNPIPCISSISGASLTSWTHMHDSSWS